MPASADQIRKSIEPGSVPHGDRAPLEAGISQNVGAGVPTPPSADGPGALPSPSNPMSALLGGEITPESAGPLTEGLSVGPGGGGDIPDSKKERLKAIAEFAESPTVRGMARVALRSYEGPGL